MGLISAADARGLYTTKLVAVYRERKAPSAFLQSFFRRIESATKNISIDVQRGTELIAVDVARGTEGNRNSFNQSTEKIFAPPYYREYFDATQLDLYDRMFGDADLDSEIFAQFVNAVADKLQILQDKISRAYEKQCADVLQTGVITLSDGTTIDFKRKAASKVTLGAAARWDTANTSDPFADLLAGAKFIREKGKAAGSLYNVIMGEDVLPAFLSNGKVTARADIRNFSLDNIVAAQRDAIGASFHGRVSAGSYNFDLWTYPELYETKSGNTITQNYYIDANKIIVLPQSPNFVLAFAAVPQLITSPTGVRKGQFIIDRYIDERNTADIHDVKSAGVAVPVAVDQIYTATVLA